ncbi:MAG TPA: OsmC family protein [Gemmatimonadota bacterium]|nr:OsmC family protein [Gemmatimonadota bacterium]
MSGGSPETVELVWRGEERFDAIAPSGIQVAIDGTKETGMSPIQALAAALGACMGTDVVDILKKGREDLTGCRIRVEGDRRETPPRRFTAIRLAIELTGWSLSRAKAERAVQLSRDTYCSVWRSMAPDIDLSVELDLGEPLLAEDQAG